MTWRETAGQEERNANKKPMLEDYVNGYVERKRDGKYEGKVAINGIALGTIQGVYFQEHGEDYLWLRRKKILEYDEQQQIFHEREPRPQWECYLKKTTTPQGVNYRGEFVFMRFKFSIIGIWDNVLGRDDKSHRLNLYIERLPMEEQSILLNINEQKKTNS